MSEETNARLAALPITILQPTFEKSSKAKALQYAIHSPSAIHQPIFDYVVILDADNIVAPDFLTRLSQIACKQEAIQCHRTAKNADNDIAALDGISEEINNSIFRRGHNRIGLSSALIGSGMCFDYEWFKANVSHLDSAVEDRELEALLLRQRIFIRYAEDIFVMDEKVSSSDNFQRQRLRWMTGQVQALFRMLPYIPKAVITGNINYIDKTIQQALIPRSILLVLIPVFTLLAFVGGMFSILSSQFAGIKWLCLFIALVLAIIIAIPSRLRTKAIFTKAFALPHLVWRMLTNLLHIKPSNKEFLHTTHQQ
jgi:cellulose synthase/poly-beta-1,6-N-acetylglucosamine synthase-like glycosyltransferase